jgi:hypothetical protein
MSVFAQVKDKVDILDAADLYGLEVSRTKKAICPFHNDTHPSLSFKGERYTCFSCGAKGDVIDLVGYLIQARSPMDTVKELNKVYHLGLDIDQRADYSHIMKARTEKEVFRQWEQEACNMYALYCRLLREWKQAFAPQSVEESPHPLFIEACTKLDYVEYLYEAVFISGSIEEKKRFYLSHWLEPEFLKQRLGKSRSDELVEGLSQEDRQHRRYAPDL